MLPFIGWLITLELLGVLAFPLTFHLFRNLTDRGYAFSKAVSILLLSYFLWILGYSQLVPNNRQTIILLTGLLLLVSALLSRRSWRAMLTFFKESKGILLATEAVFIIFFLFWAGLRAMEPAISHTEQPMDFGFLNAIIRSEHFPPNDPWLSGFSISYYYFGYLMVAFVTTLSSIPVEIAYNLGLVSIGAMAAAGAFSLVFNITHSRSNSFLRAFSFAMVGPVFLLLAGNLEGLLETARSFGLGSAGFWQWVGIKGLEAPATSVRLPPSDFWWWWRGTRVIDTVVGGVSQDYTITEFPFFSLYLGDMHPHVMALPYVLLSLGLTLNVFKAETPLGIGWLRQRPWEAVFAAFALGSLGFLNSWDSPSYTAFFLVAIFFKSFMAQGGLNRNVWKEFVPVAIFILVVAVYGYLPFYIGLESQASGILPVRGYGTRPVHYFVFWGFFVICALAFAFFAYVKVLRSQETGDGEVLLNSQIRREPVPSRKPVIAALLLPMLPLFIWSLFELALSVVEGNLSQGLAAIPGKTASLLPLMLFISALIYLSLRIAKNIANIDASRGMLFCLLLLTAGFLLTLATELFFILDHFGNRMNTIFKIYYQAWVLLAIGSASAIYYLERLAGGLSIAGRRRGLVWNGVVTLFFLMAMLYPVLAIATKAGEFRGQLTLDGLAFVQRSNPREYEAIQWLKGNVKGAPIILEATGGEYSEYGRVSSRTGLPTPIGWRGHEVQWRGSDKEFRGRDQLVDEIYSTKDLQRAQELMKALNVEYVYVGHLERAKYRQDSLAKFGSFTEKIFHNSDVTVYELKKK